MDETTFLNQRRADLSPLERALALSAAGDAKADAHDSRQAAKRQAAAQERVELLTLANRQGQDPIGELRRMRAVCQAADDEVRAAADRLEKGMVRRDRAQVHIQSLSRQVDEITAAVSRSVPATGHRGCRFQSPGSAAGSQRRAAGREHAEPGGGHTTASATGRAERARCRGRADDHPGLRRRPDGQPRAGMAEPVTGPELRAAHAPAETAAHVYREAEAARVVAEYGRRRAARGRNRGPANRAARRQPQAVAAGVTPPSSGFSGRWRPGRLDTDLSGRPTRLAGDDWLPGQRAGSNPCRAVGRPGHPRKG